MMKPHRGLFHLNRGRRLTPASIEGSEMFFQLEKRSNVASWEESCAIVDAQINDLESGAGEYDWAQLASLFGYNGSASEAEKSALWEMCSTAAKGHDVLTNKMMGLFLMWRFSCRDGWFAYVKDTDKYDAITEKEITITCYFRKK